MILQVHFVFNSVVRSTTSPTTSIRSGRDRDFGGVPLSGSPNPREWVLQPPVGVVPHFVQHVEGHGDLVYAIEE